MTTLFLTLFLGLFSFPGSLGSSFLQYEPHLKSFKPVLPLAEPVCFKKGECVGGTEAGFSQEVSADACLIAAQETPGATWFTFYGKIELCLSFSECGNFDENTECQDCISGTLIR